MNQTGILVAAIAALVAWLASRPKGSSSFGPLIHGPALRPDQPIPDVIVAPVAEPALPPGFVPGPVPGTRCPIGGDGSKLCPLTGVLLPYEVLKQNPALFSSPTGLTPDSELEALNRFRYPVQ